MLAFGTDTMFTLNGAHIWPFYDGARDQGMRVVDTRHEQTATFAAEAYAKLTRRPGLAALTAGPGVTNGISAVTGAFFNGSPVVVLGGRAGQLRWGQGSLQEMDHVPLLRPITKSAATMFDPTQAATMVHEAALAAASPHRGPVFLDFPFDTFGPSAGDLPAMPDSVGRGASPDPAAVAALAAALARAERPAFLVGGDVGQRPQVLGSADTGQFHGRPPRYPSLVDGFDAGDPTGPTVVAVASHRSSTQRSGGGAA